MAKGQITEEQLQAGMKGLSGFGALSGKPAPARRDSPFRDSRTEAPPEPKTIEVERPVEPKPEPVVRAVPRHPEPEAKPVAVPTKSVQVERPAVMRSSQAKAPQSRRKADLFTERVTLQMSAEMRDQVDELARQLQRMKTSKEERITANTVMRVAIRLLLEEFTPSHGVEINSEDDLLKALLERRSGK